MYFDNNRDDPIITDAIVVLWADEYNADRLHAFVTL